jgi:hypothetical protein
MRVLAGSEPRTLDLGRAFGAAEISAPREAPVAILNPAERAVDFGALRDPSRFVSLGTFRGERAVEQHPTPKAPAATVYHAELEAKVRESGVVGGTRSSEYRGCVNHPSTTAVEYLPGSVSATRAADAAVEATHAAWMPGDAPRGALIRLSSGAQYASEPERNGQLGSLASCVGHARGGSAGTVTLRGPAGGAARFTGSRPVPTRTYSVCVQPAVHDATHRTFGLRAPALGAAESTRRVCAPGVAAEAVAVGAGTVVARPATAMSTARASIAPGVTPSKVLVSDGQVLACVGTARAAPLRLADLGGRVLEGGHERTEREITSARLGSYRLTELGGRVLSTDGALASLTTRAGAEGGALPTIGECAGDTHARVSARTGARRIASAEAPVREAAHWASARAMQPTVRVCSEASRAPEPGGARGFAAPMARVSAMPRREGAEWGR